MKILFDFIKFDSISIYMSYDYLFYNDLPKGVKTVYINGKRLSLREFNEAKKKFLTKKGNRVES